MPWITTCFFIFLLPSPREACAADGSTAMWEMNAEIKTLRLSYLTHVLYCI